jgi:hypothetical protein
MSKPTRPRGFVKAAEPLEWQLVPFEVVIVINAMLFGFEVKVGLGLRVAMK